MPEFITGWEHSVGSMGIERPEPFWLERSGRSPAVALDEPPPKGRGVVSYGFSSSGNVPAWSRFHGDGGEAETEWLQWMVNRTDLRLRFSLTGQEPQLVEVVVERRSFAGELEEAIAFKDEGRRIHREGYEHDRHGRVIRIASSDGTPNSVDARSITDVSYGAGSPTFAVRAVGPDEEFLWPAAHAAEGTSDVLTSPAEPAEVTDAAEEMVKLLSAAIASWYERLPRSSEVTRLLLVHDWPVNPPFPPALVARSGSFSPGDNVYEFFEPDPENQAWFDPAPDELRGGEIEAAADVLNVWFLESEVDVSPLDLLIDISRAAQQEIATRTGRPVWILPFDMDWTFVGIAVIAQLPKAVADPIVAALSAEKLVD